MQHQNDFEPSGKQYLRHVKNSKVCLFSFPWGKPLENETTIGTHSRGALWVAEKMNDVGAGDFKPSK